jgi:hypothetical protein
MSETAGTETVTVAPETEAETAPDEATSKAEIDWKAKSREWERKAKANAEAAAKLAQLEESQKTEAQKLADRVSAAERAAADNELKAIRSEIALEKGLTAGQAKRLMGTTRDELEADAAQLLVDLAKNARPQGDLDQGGRSRSVATSPAQEFAHLMQAQLQRPPS